jgi:hypothetical protein
MADYPSPSKFRAAANKRLSFHSNQTGAKPGDRSYGSTMYESHGDGPDDTYVTGTSDD